jgi:Ion channel
MDVRQNWISVSGYNDYSDSELYTVAFYFTVTTIVTVGYGDVTPKNDGERIFCVILMLIGVISFSFITSTLTSIISTQDAFQA